MTSPLVGIAGVNSLLFTAYFISRRIISPFPELSLRQTALAGSMAGAVNSLLASPGEFPVWWSSNSLPMTSIVELLKVRMQGQYGAVDDKRLSRVAIDLYKKWGFRKGVMRGFWVHSHVIQVYLMHLMSSRDISGNRSKRDPGIRWVSRKTALFAYSTLTFLRWQLLHWLEPSQTLDHELTFSKVSSSLSDTFEIRLVTRFRFGRCSRAGLLVA